jgi:hypothetical protein
MAKNETTVLTVERGACRVLRLVRSGVAGVWSAAFRRTYAAPPPSAVAAVAADAVAKDETAAAAVQDSDRIAFDQAVAATGGAVTLGLPASRLLVKILRLPAATRGDLESVVALQMAKYAPFSGDHLTVSGEVVAETEEELTVFAAVLPHAAVEQLDPWLQGAGLRVERVDALLLGWWRAACAVLADDPVPVRRVFLACVANEWDLLIADGKRPVLVRGLGALADPQALAIEITLSLLNAEVESGAAPVEEVVFFNTEPLDAALTEAIRQAVDVRVRHLPPPQPDADLHGLAVRDAEASPLLLNLLPALWRARNTAADSKKRFLRGAIMGTVLWLLLAGGLFGAPRLMQQRVADVKRALAANEATFQTVQNIRTRADLIESYTDRSDSILEAMRTVADRMPPGVELTMLVYKRRVEVKLTGETSDQALAYQFKDAIENNGPFGKCIVGSVNLIQSPGKQGRHKFEITATLKKAEVRE